MENTYQPQKRTLLKGVPSFFKNKVTLFIALLVATVGVAGWAVFPDGQATATTNGIWLSIDEIKKLPMSGPAWNNLKTTADKPLGSGNISDQESNHDIYTYAVALVYARTGDQAYRAKAANAIMSVVGTEKGSRTLAVSWNLSAYVISADLINLPQYDAQKNSTFSNWLRTVRSATLDGKTLISTHEDRPNNWGTGAGASRIAVALYLNDRADLEKAITVFKGYLGDRNAYSGFSYGALSFQCDPTKPVGINPVGCKKGSVNIDGAIPDDMRRGTENGEFKEPPAITHYPWTALQGAVTQAKMLSRQGYDSFGWSNQAIKRSVQYLFDLSRRADGNWWATNTAAKWVPWIVNGSYGSNFPTSANEDWGRVMNFTDWTHAKPVQETKDTNAPTTPVNLSISNKTEKNVQLNWGASTDNITVTGYEVSRDNEVLGFTGGTAYTDTTAAANKTYAYKVRAFDAAGNASGQVSVSVITTPALGDTAKPITGLTKPSENATITTESTPITFSATDNVGVTKIELYVDTQLEATVTDLKGKSSFSASWNTKSSGNGKHTLQVKAYDAAGNQGVSGVVTVNVAVPGRSNPGNPTPPPPSSGGQEVSFTSSADARMSQANSSKNYGGEDFLRIRNSGSESWRSIVKFDVSGLGGAPKSVKLRMFATDGGPDAGTLFATSNNWSEGTINWNTTPINANVYRVGKSTSVSVNDQSWAEWDLTAWIKNNGSYTYGITSDDDNSVYYNSREGKNKPTLVIVR